MYERMTKVNTNFANWLWVHTEATKATSKIFKEFSSETFPSAVVNQTIRDVKFQKKQRDSRNSGACSIIKIFRLKRMATTTYGKSRRTA
jgi:hypothetical protein